ncbi:MAG TPA: hypothetical protein PLR25_15445 [Planctomycetaceae bacterium]|nr:hypothetical protein [Planctomycetaceae bacterium]
MTRLSKNGIVPTTSAGVRQERQRQAYGDLQRIITVSLETMKIVNNLPKLDID